MYVFEYIHAVVVSFYREATWDVTNGYPSIMGVIDGVLIGPPRQTCAAHNRLSHLIDLRDLTSQPIKTRDVTITLIMWIPLCFLAAGSIDRVIPLKVPGVLVQWPFRKRFSQNLVSVRYVNAALWGFGAKLAWYDKWCDVWLLGAGLSLSSHSSPDFLSPPTPALASHCRRSLPVLFLVPAVKT